MKIAFLLPCSGIGGGARAIVQFGNGLVQKGHSVRILYGEERETLYNRIRSRYIELRYPQGDWVRNFSGETIGYSILEEKCFDSDELIISMCSKTTLDAQKVNRGIKVFYCHGAELEDWKRIKKAWSLDIPKLAVSSKPR